MASSVAMLAACSRPAPQRHTVTIRNFAFEPGIVTVAPGDTVVWTNADFVPHTITARTGGWDSKSVAAGGTWGFTARAPGRYEYYCVFHPNMTGTVVVRGR